MKKTRPQTEETRRKISESLKKHKKFLIGKSTRWNFKDSIGGAYSSVYKCTCHHCGTISFLRGQRKYCSDHANLYKSNNRNKYAFTFNIFNYPDLFDTKIVKEKGFHSYGGRHNYNPDGLTRDHKISVNEAIKNSYDPYYIKHPLNCEIMTFIENDKKKTKSSISYEDLVKQVDEYDQLRIAIPCI